MRSTRLTATSPGTASLGWPRYSQLGVSGRRRCCSGGERGAAGAPPGTALIPVATLSGPGAQGLSRGSRPGHLPGETSAALPALRLLPQPPAERTSGVGAGGAA